MKKVLFGLFLVLVFSSVSLAGPRSKPTKANQTHHTITGTTRPFKAFGHAVKVAAVDVGKFSFTAFDAAVIDPLGVALQAFADGVDMFVAAPLESLPEPFESVGDGVHYVYLGVDKVGQVLAK